jgi:hypothetical protein
MMRGAVEARRRPNQFAGARERSRPRPLALPRETGFAPEVSPRETRSSAASFISRIIPCKKERSHGFRRLSDRARRERADPHRALGGFLVSAKIIQFVPRPSFGHRSHESSQPLCLLRWPDDLAMDHADTAPCEYAPPPSQGEGEDEPA